MIQKAVTNQMWQLFFTENLLTLHNSKKNNEKKSPASVVLPAHYSH